MIFKWNNYLQIKKCSSCRLENYLQIELGLIVEIKEYLQIEKLIVDWRTLFRSRNYVQIEIQSANQRSIPSADQRKKLRIEEVLHLQIEELSEDQRTMRRSIKYFICRLMNYLDQRIICRSRNYCWLKNSLQIK